MRLTRNAYFVDYYWKQICHTLTITIMKAEGVGSPDSGHSYINIFFNSTPAPLSLLPGSQNFVLTARNGLRDKEWSEDDFRPPNKSSTWDDCSIWNSTHLIKTPLQLSKDKGKWRPFSAFSLFHYCHGNTRPLCEQLLNYDFIFVLFPMFELGLKVRRFN